MIRAAIKETVVDLAMAGLARCCLSYIEKNPYQRMHRISEECFGLMDHKQMLASVVVKHLVDDGRVIKYQPVKSDKYGQILYVMINDPYDISILFMSHRVAYNERTPSF